jgi:phospholipase C
MPPDHVRHPDYVPTPPTNQVLPVQERGLRRARALPYEIDATGKADVAHSTFRIDFANTGKAGVCFQVRSGNTIDGPWTYTVEAGQSLWDEWNLAPSQGKYDLSVFGPNGFLRSFRGTASSHAKANLAIDSRYDADDLELILTVSNRGSATTRVKLANAYGNDVDTGVLRPGQSFYKRWSLRESFGWYDVTIESDTERNFLWRLAGHIENGRDSASDPALGGVGHRGHGWDDAQESLDSEKSA